MADAEFLTPVEFLRSAGQDRIWQEQEALNYTRWLATSHYENFHVVSFLLPGHLHQDFYNVYSFCRWADDLGDEIGDPAESLRLLAWWRSELREMFSGRARHPVFAALRGTAEKHQLPELLFDDLIKAFEQDQRQNRYRDWPDILRYCEYSANPVGRLVLMLCGYSDPERFALSDATCTALQLANHWQDVTVDLGKDRVYLPLDLLERHGCTVEQIFERRFTPGFRAAMQEACAEAGKLFLKGLPLAGMVNRRLSIDLELFSRGGMQVLRKIARQDYDVLKGRPVITKLERAGLLLGAIARRGFSRAAA